MKKYLLYITSFLLLLLTSYAGYYAYMTHKTALLQADIYVWGDSRMYWGVNTELLEQLTGKDVVCTAQEGAGAYDMMVFVERVPNLSTCILGYSDCVLFRYHESDYNRSGCDWRVLAEMALHTDYSISELYSIAKLNTWKPKQLETEGHEYFECGDTVATPEPWDGWYAMYTNDFPHFPSKGVCYERAIQRLLDKDCRVVLLDLPGYPEMERLAGEGAKNRHLSDSLRARIIEEYRLPVDTIAIQSDSLLYYDLSHLNELGAALLTEQLYKHLDQTRFIKLKVIE